MIWLVVVLLGWVVILFALWRNEMSKTAELTAAVDAAVAKINELETASTLDSEIQPQIDKLNAAVTPPPAQ